MNKKNKLKGVCKNVGLLRVGILFVVVLCVFGHVSSTLPFSQADTIEVYYGPEDPPGG